MKKLETTNVELELSIINKLLSFDAGEQIYRKEINTLFQIIYLKSNPTFILEETKI